MDLRSFLFKKRSYTPIPIVLAILYFSQLSYPFWAMDRLYSLSVN